MLRLNTDKMQTETEDGMFFRVVHVFDLSQTDGPDLPTVDVPTIDKRASSPTAAAVPHASSFPSTRDLTPAGRAV